MKGGPSGLYGLPPHQSCRLYATAGHVVVVGKVVVVALRVDDEATVVVEAAAVTVGGADVVDVGISKVVVVAGVCATVVVSSSAVVTLSLREHEETRTTAAATAQDVIRLDLTGLPLLSVFLQASVPPRGTGSTWGVHGLGLAIAYVDDSESTMAVVPKGSGLIVKIWRSLAVSGLYTVILPRHVFRAIGTGADDAEEIGQTLAGLFQARGTN